MIPLQLKLKRRSHKEIAYAQDIIVETLYEFFQKAVIHGGTSIWRCYQGNRFSEDIDVYIKKDEKALELFFKALEKKGFKLLKKRIKENSLYSSLQLNDAIVRFEALFKNIKDYTLKEYETSEAVLINVFTLSPEDLMEEKIQAYSKRRKIRDLYDIFFLLRYLKEYKPSIKSFIENYKSPLDEENLKSIIISGPAPTSQNILEYIKRWGR